LVLILAVLFLAQTVAQSALPRLGVPPADAAMQNYPCANGKSSYIAKTGLTSCKLAREAAFGEAQLPEDSTIFLSPEGKPVSAFLSRDTTIHGYLCHGDHHNGYATAFYPGGELKVCWLAADQEVRGVPCMQAGFIADVFGGTVGVYFYQSGKLQTCKLSRDATIQERKFKRGEHIYLDADGRVIQ
jgi:hypothetical protein